MDEEATNRPTISVRHIREDETRAVRSLASSAFSWPEGALFSPPPQTLVAGRDGHLVRVILPKVALQKIAFVQELQSLPKNYK